MRARHATLKSNLDSIMRDGLLPEKARGKRKACWIHTPAKTAWAIIHTTQNHKCRVEDIVVLEVEVPRSWLTRHQTGLWYCSRVIEPSRIVNVTEATVYAQSPVHEE